MKGPVAPKDPTKQRPKLYFMLEDNLVTSNPSDNGFSETIFLEGRVKNKLQLICPALSEELCGRLQSSKEFFEIVHSVGITVQAEKEEDREIPVVCALQHYGKSNKYVTGSWMRMEICPDGAERVFPLSEFSCTEEDDILGTLYFYSAKEGLSAKATIVFYLNDGYSVPEPEIDPPIAYDAPAYREMLSRSLLSLGNTYRLRRAIEKAARGEDVTIAFIGGSITQGAGAKPIESKCYAYQIYKSFAETYAEKPEAVHLIKVGMGGTSSELGLLRYERDVLRGGAGKPDIVIVEFAVNDEGDETKGVCYESLLAKIWNGPGEPAVLLLFSVFMNDWNLQDRLAPIGTHYQLPMVSVLDAVSPQFAQPEGRVLTKRQYFYDCFHPTNDGHRIMADCVMYLLEQSLAHVSEPPVWPEEACLSRAYESTVLISRNTAPEALGEQGIFLDCGSFTETDTVLQAAELDLDATATPMFTDNWMRPSDCPDETPFAVRLRCRSCFVIFKDSGDLEAGRADIFVNGSLVRTCDPKEIGWTHCHAALVIPDGEAAEYEIKIYPNGEDKKKRFTILGLAYVR